MGLRSPVFLAVECRARRRLAGESGDDHYLSPDYAGGLRAGLPPSQLTSNPCTRPDRPAEATLAIQKACCCLPRGRRLVPAFSAIHPQRNECTLTSSYQTQNAFSPLSHSASLSPAPKLRARLLKGLATTFVLKSRSSTSPELPFWSRGTEGSFARMALVWRMLNSKFPPSPRQYSSRDRWANSSPLLR